MKRYVDLSVTVSDAPNASPIFVSSNHFPVSIVADLIRAVPQLAAISSGWGSRRQAFVSRLSAAAA